MVCVCSCVCRCDCTCVCLNLTWALQYFFDVPYPANTSTMAPVEPAMLAAAPDPSTRAAVQNQLNYLASVPTNAAALLTWMGQVVPCFDRFSCLHVVGS